MTDSKSLHLGRETLEYLANHIFFPVKLPQHDDQSPQNDLILCKLVLREMRAFDELPNCKDWEHLQKMMQNLVELHHPDACLNRITNLLSKASANDVLVFSIRAQNACLIIRTHEDETVYETCRVDPPNEVIMTTIGRVTRYFPEASVTIPKASLSPEFHRELASFLMNMDNDVLEDAAPFTRKAGKKVLEVRDTADSHYITQLLMSILSGLRHSRPSVINAITKHTRNDINWSDAYKPWRRSPLWLIIRIAIQCTLHQLGHPPDVYKRFMIFFMARILSMDQFRQLPSDLLFYMQSKVANRMRKLALAEQEITPFTRFVIDAMKENKVFLHRRWEDIRKDRNGGSEEWAPENLDFCLDTQIRLFNSRHYLEECICAVENESTSNGFTPNEYHRLFTTLNPFNELNPTMLSDALQRDCRTALFDFEHFVLHHLGDLEFVPLALDPPTLGKCIETYIQHAHLAYKGNPELQSIMLLTVFVLWATLDKIVISRIPFFCYYSPEVPTALLQPLMLSKSLHINCYMAFQTYLSERHEKSQTHLPSIFGEQALHDAFAVRFFDWQPSEAAQKLRSLQREIQANATQARANKRSELNNLKQQERALRSQAASLSCDYTWKGWHSGKCYKCELEGLADSLKIDVHEWPLPEHHLQAKSVVFELCVPTEFGVWRDITYKMSFPFSFLKGYTARSFRIVAIA